MKRIFTTMLVFCMVLSLLAVGALAAGYTDVAPGAWYEDEVLYCQENGLLDGIGGGLFDPDGTTTRGMLVTALWRLAGKPVAVGADFDDVAAGAYYTEAVAWASSAKIAEGYGNGKFGPNDLLTREQLVTILFRYAKNIGYDVSVGEDTNILSYDDAFTVSEWAIPAMQWACGDGVIEGIGTTLQPKAAADRAQLAVVLCRFDEKTEEAPVTPTVHFHTYTVNGDGTHTRCCDNVTEACLADANGKCYTCGYQFVAAIGTEYYNSVSAALAAAAENDTIQLLAGHFETIAFTKSTKANLTIVGGEGVTVGTVRLVETTNYGAPEGLTLQNIVFNGQGITSSGTGNSVKDLAVLGCEFTNGAVIHISDGVTDGLTVESCTFRKTDSSVNAKEKTAILVQNNASNVEIKYNSIADCEHNAIQFTKIVGEFSVIDNVIDGTGSRALRLVAKAGAQLNITDNIIRDVNTNPTEEAENNGEIVKISGAVTNSVPLASYGNTIDDIAMVWEGDSADFYAYAAMAKIGDVHYVSAQAALDDAKDGDTIELFAGNHGDLYIRITEDSELVADTYYYMSNYGSNYYGQPAWQYAKRTINNLTITGENGAVIQSLRATDDRDDNGNAKGTRNNMFEINNLTVFGLTILDGVHFNTSSYTVSVSETGTAVAPHIKLNGLTIDSCNNGTGGNTTQAGGRSMLGISNTGSVSNAKNIVVQNCTVFDAFQGVYLVDGENVKIVNNFFSGLAHNSVHINKFCSGTIDIKDNQMDGVADRPIRMSGVKSGTVTISDNDIVNSTGDNGQYFKASSMDSSVVLNWTNNTIDGTAIALTTSGSDIIGKVN